MNKRRYIDKNATQLKVGDRVMWKGDPKDLGTVVDTGYAALTITWDDGQTGTIAVDDLRDYIELCQHNNIVKVECVE